MADNTLIHAYQPSGVLDMFTWSHEGFGRWKLAVVSQNSLSKNQRRANEVS